MEQSRLLRPMGLLEIVDHSFRLYRANFWLFFGIAAFLGVPQGFLMAVPEYGQGLANGWAVLVALFVNGALTKAISDSYLGRPVSFGQCYGYMLKRFFPFVLTALCAYLFVLSGVILLFVGAIVFAIWTLTFLAPMFVIEDKRYFSVIKRGKFLMGQGTWGDTVGLGIIVGILMLAVTLSFVFVGSRLAGMLGVASTAAFLVQGLLLGIAQTLVQPLGLTSTTLIYYDSRIRKEGFDLQILAQEMGMSLPPAAQAPAGEMPSMPAEKPSMTNKE